MTSTPKPAPATGAPEATDLTSRIRRAAERMQLVHPLPDSLSDIVRQSADAAVDGVVIAHYQGAHRLAIGRRQIDWLNPSFVGNQTAHFLWRAAFIRDLATAYHVSRDERYAEAARDYLFEYMAAWPTDAIGANADVDSTLTLCGRNAAWTTSLSLLVGSPAFDAEFVARLVAFIAAQYDYLRKNVKTGINWRVFEARSLLLGSLYLAFLDQAADWQRHSVRILNDAWFRQFLPDGVHYERNPIYHTGMAGTFRDLFRLGRQMPELGLVMTLDRLASMYDFALACVKPNGYMCGLHDSQSEFSGHLRDGVHTTSHKAVDNTRTWEEFRRESNLPLERPATSQVFPDAGLAFMRTGWDEDAGWMSFDGTQWGGGHCHLSRNAIQLHAFRQSMVIDPGWLSYESNAWGTYGRSTRAHSTCNLGGRSQSSTNPGRLEWHGAPGYDALLSVYEGGYWDTELKWNFTHAGDGLWAQHARIVFWVQDRFAFVADSMFRLPQHPGDPEAERPSYECVWQLAPGAQVDLQPERDRATARWKDAGLLLLTPIRPKGSRYEIHTGEKDPLRGWAPGEGAHHPAPQIVLNTPRMERPHDYYVSVLTPFKGAQAPEVEVEAKSPMGQLGYVRLRWADGTEDAVYWGCNFNLMLGKQPDFETDSSLVHLRKDAAGRVTRGCCVNGTYLEPFSPTARHRPDTFTF